MSEFHNKFRTILEARFEELTKMNDLSEGARETVSLDQQSIGRLSRMDALQQQAMAQATERQRLGDMARINAALKRLDEGEYGVCLECGENIGEQRLEVDPTAALCIPCARTR